MGAEFVTLKVKSTDFKKVKKEFDYAQEQCLYDNGHSYSGGIGMAQGIKPTYQTFKSYDDAEQWLSDNCEKWESALAVTIEPEKGTAYTLIGALCSS